ncbi:MAG: hypothetical protein Q8912_12655 [Bacillota bacterium]|nr:hypothetical protein [Bacillota bacterium]
MKTNTMTILEQTGMLFKHPKVLDNIRNKQDKMLESYSKPEMPADILNKLTDYFIGCGFDQQLIDGLKG